jgi:hypothetical protein
MGRNRDLELIEEPLLVWRGLGHSPEPDLSAVGCGQDDVCALHGGELRQGLCWCEARPAPV